MNESAPLDWILDEVARGNREAFLELIRAHSLPLRSYLASQVHRLEEVDDLAQEVFISAFHSLDTFQRGSSMSAWLRGIARHKLFNFYRSSSRRDQALE